MHATTWMNLENVMLNEGIQTQGSILYNPIHVKCYKKIKFTIEWQKANK